MSVVTQRGVRRRQASRRHGVMRPGDRTVRGADRFQRNQRSLSPRREREVVGADGIGYRHCTRQGVVEAVS